MKRRFVLSIAAIALASLALPQCSQAESWIFAAPVYKPPKPQPTMVQSRANRGPYFSEPHGSFTGSSFRFMDSFINIQGRSVDNYMVTQTYNQQGTEGE